MIHLTLYLHLLFALTLQKDATVEPAAGARLIHIFVALCDNEHQGIVKVPKGIGNGQDPASNLYWGCGYGVKTFFNKSSEWKKVKTFTLKTRPVLERILWKHRDGTYLLADAYDGRDMKACMEEYMQRTAGNSKLELKINDSLTLSNERPILTAFVGHNGMMDMLLELPQASSAKEKIPTILLCCIAKSYFGDYLQKLQTWPLVWTTGLMAPEAYTLHDAIKAWMEKKKDSEVADAAARAYDKYQKCGFKAARRLLVTGF